MLIKEIAGGFQMLTDPIYSRWIAALYKRPSDRLTGSAAVAVGAGGLLEMRVTESVRFSGVRWIVQQIPRAADGTGGYPIAQDGGIVEGMRTVRGTVTGTSAGSTIGASSSAMTRARGSVPE